MSGNEEQELPGNHLPVPQPGDELEDLCFMALSLMNPRYATTVALKLSTEKSFPVGKKPGPLSEDSFFSDSGYYEPTSKLHTGQSRNIGLVSSSASRTVPVTML